MKYRKKPVVIEAIQFTRSNIDDVKKFTNNKINIVTERRINGKMYCEINTKEGIMSAIENDWIIKEAFPTGDRDFYPCKPDIFELTYELVKD